MSAENTRDYYRNQGAQAERSRIIKLLESRKCPCYCEIHMVLDPAIEAIKGEK